ncbi:MAG: hypothetical protein U0905_03755 [Pirellulales bacterium]
MGPCAAWSRWIEVTLSPVAIASTYGFLQNSFRPSVDTFLSQDAVQHFASVRFESLVATRRDYFEEDVSPMSHIDRCFRIPGVVAPL